MNNMENLYSQVQKNRAPVSSNQLPQENLNEIYSVAENAPDDCEYDHVPRNTEIYSVPENAPDDCEYDHLPRNTVIPNNNKSSTPTKKANESTDGEKDKKSCVLYHALVLAFLSLLVGSAAICLVFVFNDKSSSEQRLSNAEKESLLLAKKIQDFDHQLENVTIMLKLEQNNGMENFKALQGVKNKTIDLEKQTHGNLQKLNLLTTKEEKNELNETLMTFENTITDIQKEYSEKLEQLQQQQQNIIYLLHQSHRLVVDTGWLTLSNGFQYRRTHARIGKWGDARAECQNLGGDLASVGIRSDNIRKFLMLNFLTESSDYWIGLKMNGTSNNWYWIDDTDKNEVKNQIWSKNEPNNLDWEKCAVLFRRGFVIGVNNVSCFLRSYYAICEKQTT